MNLTVEQRIQRAVLILMHEPALTALCGVMMVGTRTVKDDCPTAYTDGLNEVYGRAYVGKLSDKQLRGLILHELGHKMFMHLTTWQHLWKIDPHLTNIAADYVVDQWVQDLITIDKVDAEVPDPLIDPAFKGMSVQQVFDILGKEKQQNKGKPRPRPGGKDEHDHGKAQAMTQAEKDDIAQQIDSAIRQGAMMSDKLGSGGSRALGDLLESKIDWRQALREFFSTTCAGNDYSTWARPNRRFMGEGFYMPSGVSQRVGEIAVAIDTSGSIGGAELNNFLTEVKAICDQVKPERVRLLYWDTSICADELYEFNELGSLVQSTKPAGGGGTDASCIPQYITAKGYTPQAVVVLTDGYVCSWGSWVHPLLWCIMGSKAVPPVGKVVYVE